MAGDLAGVSIYAQLIRADRPEYLSNSKKRRDLSA